MEKSKFELLNLDLTSESHDLNSKNHRLSYCAELCLLLSSSEVLKLLAPECGRIFKNRNANGRTD